MVMTRNARILAILVGFRLYSTVLAENPIFQTYYSPDPAPVMFGDTVCVYTGNDEGGSGFTMHGWRVSCSTDMVNWTDMGELILSNADFGGNAKQNSDWAAQVVRRNGKYYYYVTVESAIGGGRAINVAVADKPQGPFRDARNGQRLGSIDGRNLASRNMSTLLKQAGYANGIYLVRSKNRDGVMMQKVIVNGR